MRDIPKRIKRLLREYAEIAHEEELRRALLPLATAFEEWKKGTVSSGELSVMIHEFHQGSARALFNKYNSTWLDLSVAHAIHSGVLEKERVPQELLDHLATAIASYENQEKDS